MKSNIVEAIWLTFFEVGQGGDGRVSRRQLFGALKATPKIANAISLQCLEAVDGEGVVSWNDLMEMLTSKAESTPWNTDANPLSVLPVAQASPPVATTSVLCFGEALLIHHHSAEQASSRVKAPEMVTAAAVAALGGDASWISVLPDGAPSESVLEHASGLGVSTDSVVRVHEGAVATGHSVGPATSPMYFQRAGSAFANAEPGLFRWEELLRRGRYHWLYSTAAVMTLGAGISQAWENAQFEAAASSINTSLLVGRTMSLAAMRVVCSRLIKRNSLLESQQPGRNEQQGGLVLLLDGSAALGACHDLLAGQSCVEPSMATLETVRLLCGASVAICCVERQSGWHSLVCSVSGSQLQSNRRELSNAAAEGPEAEERCELWMAGFMMAVGPGVKLSSLSQHQLHMAVDCGDTVAAQGVAISHPAEPACPAAIPPSDHPTEHDQPLHDSALRSPLLGQRADSTTLDTTHAPCSPQEVGRREAWLRCLFDELQLDGSGQAMLPDLQRLCVTAGNHLVTAAWMERELDVNHTGLVSVDHFVSSAARLLDHVPQSDFDQLMSSLIDTAAVHRREKRLLLMSSLRVSCGAAAAIDSVQQSECLQPVRVLDQSHLGDFAEAPTATWSEAPTATWLRGSSSFVEASDCTIRSQVDAAAAKTCKVDAMGHILVTIRQGAHVSQELLVRCAALAEAGCTAFQVSADHQEVVPIVEALVQLLGAHSCMIGVTDVLDVEVVGRVAAAGATFVSSPVLVPMMVQTAHNAGILALPGAATPSELWKCAADGADGVCLFPSSGWPPSTLRALPSKMRHMHLVLSGGGVSAHELQPWLSKGVPLNSISVSSAVLGSLNANSTQPSRWRREKSLELLSSIVKALQTDSNAAVGINSLNDAAAHASEGLPISNGIESRAPVAEALVRPFERLDDWQPNTRSNAPSKALTRSLLQNKENALQGNRETKSKQQVQQVETENQPTGFGANGKAASAGLKWQYGSGQEMMAAVTATASTRVASRQSPAAGRAFTRLEIARFRDFKRAQK